MFKFIVTLISSVFFSCYMIAQCNVSASICQTGTSQPFDFLQTSGPYAGGSFVNAGCATGAGGSHIYGFITLNITTGGPLNLLIDGNANNGFVDVAIFNIPPGVAPCDAVMNSANAIGCNYASQAGGCVQFGNAFPCGSSVPAPNVQAGQEIMIIAQSWSTNASTTFTLELGPLPGAQSGPPDATIHPINPLCTTDSPVQMTANNLGGVWSGPGISSSGLFNPSTAGSGTHTISYTIGTAPCQDSDQTQVTVYPEATVSAEIVGEGSSVTICQGEEVTITASGAYSYLWNQGLGAGATHNVSPNSTTTYIVTGTNEEGCTATASVTVNISPTPIVTASSDQIICIDEETTISASATGGSSFNYHWDHTSDLSSTQTVSPENPTTYTVFAENEFGCLSNTDEVFIDIYPPLSASISPNDTVCPTQTGTLNVYNVSGGNGGPYSYEWRDNNGNIVGTDPTLNFVINQTTVFTVTISDNCTTPVVVLTGTIVAGEVPGVTFSVNDAEQCQTGIFTFTNETDPNLTDETYWLFGNGASYQNLNTVTFEEDNPGSYYAQLIVVSFEGCRDTVKIENYFSVLENPIARFTWTPFKPKMTLPDVYFYNQSYLGEQYLWTFESGNPAMTTEENPEVSFPQDSIGEYLVTLIVQSSEGCFDSTANLVEVIPDVMLYVPNTFTPDGDKFNETWRVYVDGIDIYNFSLFIYNRWGEIIWESHDPEAEWDGTYGGKPVPEGMYIWVLRVADYTTDKKHEFKGHINLLR